MGYTVNQLLKARLKNHDKRQQKQAKIKTQEAKQPRGVKIREHRNKKDFVVVWQVKFSVSNLFHKTPKLKTTETEIKL